MTRDEAIEIIMESGPGPPLGSPEHRQLMEFLETSPECRRLYDQQKQLWETLNVWQPIEPSPEFDRRVSEKVNALAARQPWYQRMLVSMRPGFAVSLAGLVLAAGAALRQQPRPAPSPVVAEDSRVIEQIDRALSDMEMLAEFDVLPLAELKKDES